MHILENIFHRAQEHARKCGDGADLAPQIAVQLLAWRKLSERTGTKLSGTYKDALRLPPQECYAATVRAMTEALEMDITLPRAWESPELQNLMLWLGEVNLDNLADGNQLAFKLAQVGDRDTQGATLPPEVVSLMLALAGPLAGKSVYCPFDQPLTITTSAAIAGGVVSAELRILSPLPAAIRLLTGLNFEVSFSHPINRPAYKDGNDLRKFDVAIVNSPWGFASTMHYRDDPHFRFTGDEKFIEHQVLRHLFRQVNGQSVIAVPLSLLFGSQIGLKRLRSELIEKGWLKAVITLPTGLLPTTAIGFAILVIDTSANATQTLFVDADHDRYNERDGRSRSRLTGYRVLQDDIEQAFSGEPIETGRMVSHEEIQAHDCQLQVNRYLKSNTLQRVLNYLSTKQTVELGDIVEVLRPSLPDRENGIDALEASISDFPFVGYLRSASKHIQVSVRRNTKSLNLRPNDILIVTKGAESILGKVAIVGEEALEQGWVANQMSLVLRVISDRIDPRYLYRYLQSDLARVQVLSMNLGSTIPNLRPSDLKSLLVPVPSLQEQQSIVQAFKEIVSLQAEIDALEKRRQELAVSSWPMFPAESTNAANAV